MPDVEGNAEGAIRSLAIGAHVLQLGSSHGARVEPRGWNGRRAPRPRAGPVRLLPPPFPELLGRGAEIDAVAAALRPGHPLEIFGEAGIGKTALLRALAHHPAAAAFPDGAVYLAGSEVDPDDLLQRLFEVFCEPDEGCKPSEEELRGALQARRALLLLDDVCFDRAGVERIAAVLAASSVVVATPFRRLFGDGQSFAVAALAPEAALALIARELRRPLRPEELAAAARLCTAVRGHPLRLLQAAAAVRSRGVPLEQVAHGPAGPAFWSALELEVSRARPLQRDLLWALAASRGAGLAERDLAAVSGCSEVAPALAPLLEASLVRVRDGRYVLCEAAAAVLEPSESLVRWCERLAAYLIHLGSERKSRAELLPLLPVLRAIAGWARDVGRSADLLALVRAFEAAVALSGRWGAWQHLLEHGLEAAAQRADPVLQAWAQHQLGVRALCLEQSAEAGLRLERALWLREQLGDARGAEQTRRGLALLERSSSAVPRILAGPGIVAVGAALVLVLGVAVRPRPGGEAALPAGVEAPAIAGLNLDAVVEGGALAHGEIILDGVAPQGGLTVALSSSDASVATVPAAVAVRAGEWSAPFDVDTRSVRAEPDAEIEVTIHASLGADQRSETVLVRAPPHVSDVRLPPYVRGGETVELRVTLSRPAPPEGVVLAVASDQAAARPAQSSLRIRAGQSAGELSIRTRPVRQATRVAITLLDAQGASALGFTLLLPGPPPH